MEFEMTVHSVSMHKTPAKVLYEGVEIDAEVATLEVWLADCLNGAGAGSMKFEFRGGRIEEARRIFVVDHTVTLTAAPTGNWIPGKEPDAPVVDGPHADPDQSEDAQRSRAGASSTEEHAQE